jgi:hypothetical protein
VPASTAAPIASAAPTSCPTASFCYPRLGIAGTILPYEDCQGRTDIGAEIRSFSCLSQLYLIGHAWTAFGGIKAYAADDVVYALGRRFTVYDGFVQASCAAPARPLAPLSMQTSLTLNACGPVLVVQAR